MTFREFARNYINPFYLMFRIFWLWGAFLLFFLAPYIDGLTEWKFVFYLIAVLFVWIGIRPWGGGVSLNDLNRKLDEINKRR